MDRLLGVLETPERMPNILCAFGGWGKGLNILKEVCDTPSPSAAADVQCL